jgi:hypothetical protein
MPAATLTMPDPSARQRLAAFVARVVRLDRAAVVRLHAADGQVDAWAQTTFDALTTLSVPGAAQPADVTVGGNELLAALAVERTADVDPGTRADASWRAELPPRAGWEPAAEVPAAELEGLTERGLALAREHADAHGAPPAELLDQVVLTAGEPPRTVQVPLRCLFALAGMGLSDGVTPIRVAAMPGWLRLDAPFGSVVRLRRMVLPLIATR